MKITIHLLFISLLLISTGCASVAKSWKALISGGEAKEQTAARAKPSGVSFSQQNNLVPSSYRQYKRTTRKDVEDTSHLESKAGSLWVMEGQGAFLFSQNVVRMIGDPLAIRIEGGPSEQLASKTKVISQLLAQIEERRRRALGREPADDKTEGNEKSASEKPKAAQQGAAATAAGGSTGATAAVDESKYEFNVKTVPTRVVERLVDGNYRVRGIQPFMIGQREYKVIVSGIVRAEDFNEEGIAAPQLLDSSFDIVSSKSMEMRQ